MLLQRASRVFFCERRNELALPSIFPAIEADDRWQAISRWRWRTVATEAFVYLFLKHSRERGANTIKICASATLKHNRMESVVENLIARGWFESRGVRYAIEDAHAFRATNAPLLRDNIDLLRKRGTYALLHAFMDRHRLFDALNMTMFSAFCSCEKERLELAIGIVEQRMRAGEHILHPLPLLIKLMRAIEHKFLKGRDKHTYDALQKTHWNTQPRRVRTW